MQNLIRTGIAACGFVAAAFANAAVLVPYPEKDPLFTIEVPQGWEVKHEHGAVKLVAQSDAIFVLQHVDNVKNDDTAAVAMADLATLQGKNFSLQDTKVARPTTMTLMGDFKGFIIECTGKSPDGKDTSWQLMLFSAKNEDYYLATAFWANEDAEKTSADRSALFKSLKALRGN